MEEGTIKHEKKGLKTELHMPRFKLFEHVSALEKINFARHLAVTIKAGLPLFEALKIIRRQSGSKLMERILDQIITDISNGQFLADSLMRYRHIFGDFFINIIRVGESSGTLGPNLLYLADELKKAKELRSKMRSAMIYPVVILLATLGLTSLLMFFVFPKVIPIFSSLKVTLPFTTRFLIAMVKFFMDYGWWVLGGVAAIAIGFRFFLKLERFRYGVYRVMFHIPVLASLIVDLNLANFSRVLGVLLRSGVKIVEAIRVTASTFDNPVYHRSILEAEEKIRRGEAFAQHLSSERKFFPPLLVSMVEIGENTGNLQENLFYLSEYYTEEADNSLRNLTTLLEPLLLLVMGIVVGFIAMAIITPIYSITSTLGSGGK